MVEHFLSRIWNVSNGFVPFLVPNVQKFHFMTSCCSINPVFDIVCPAQKKQCHVFWSKFCELNISLLWFCDWFWILVGWQRVCKWKDDFTILRFYDIWLDKILGRCQYWRKRIQSRHNMTKIWATYANKYLTLQYLRWTFQRK